MKINASDRLEAAERCGAVTWAHCTPATLPRRSRKHGGIKGTSSYHQDFIALTAALPDVSVVRRPGTQTRLNSRQLAPGGKRGPLAARMDVEGRGEDPSSCQRRQGGFDVRAHRLTFKFVLLIKAGPRRPRHFNHLRVLMLRNQQVGIKIQRYPWKALMMVIIAAIYIYYSPGWQADRLTDGLREKLILLYIDNIFYFHLFNVAGFTRNGTIIIQKDKKKHAHIADIIIIMIIMHNL